MLGRGFTANLLGELKVWAMAGVLGSSAMAAGFSAAADGASGTFANRRPLFLLPQAVYRRLAHFLA